MISEAVTPTVIPTLFECTYDRKALLSAFRALAPFAPKRHPKAILTHAFLCIDGNGALSVRATDLETFATYTVDDPAFRGLPSTIVSTVVHADSFAFLRVSGAEKVTVTIADPVFAGERSTVFETSNGERMTFDGLEVDEAPIFPRFPDWHRLTVPAHEFGALLRAVVPAASKHQGRYAMHGIRLAYANSGLITATATDGRRLHHAERTYSPSDTRADRLAECADAHSDESPSVGILPRSVAVAMGRALPKKAPKSGVDEVQIALRETSSGLGELHGFRYGPLEIVARGIEGEFPRYEAVMSKSFEHTVTVDCAALLRAVAVAAVGASKDNPCISFGLDRGALQVGGATVNGTFHSEHGVSTKQVRLNPNFFSDAIKVQAAASDGRTMLRWNNPRSPLELTSFLVRTVMMPITLEV